MKDFIATVHQALHPETPQHPSFKAGDLISVHVRIQERGKERIQPFEGIVIQCKGDTPANKTFTVRKVSHGVGVERIFPLLCPNIAKIEVQAHGQVRRARLYYLRGKQGHAAKVKTKKVDTPVTRPA